MAETTTVKVEFDEKRLRELVRAAVAAEFPMRAWNPRSWWLGYEKEQR